MNKFQSSNYWPTSVTEGTNKKNTWKIALFSPQIKNSYHLRQFSLNLTELFSLGLRTGIMQNIQKA